MLLISSRFPFPAIGGDKLKTFNLIKILSKFFDVTFVCLSNKPLNDAEESFCRQYFAEYKVFVKSNLCSYFKTFLGILSSKPLQVSYYHFNDVQKFIDEQVPRHDFAINVLIRTSEYLLKHDIPKYLDIVDSIALNYKRSKSKVKSLLWKLIYKIETRRLYSYEQRCVKAYVNTFFVNRDESEYWGRFGNTTWIPNGVSPELFVYDKKNENYKNHVAFFGKMDYQPNIDACFWFVEHVLPKLNEKIKFVIVGADPSPKILQLASERIDVVGFISDPYLILKNSLLVAAPMQTGGGIQNKILEAMAIGAVTITTTLGASPIVGARDGHELLVRDDAAKMADTINDMLENGYKYDSIKTQAKYFIRNNYTWERYEDSLMKVLS